MQYMQYIQYIQYNDFTVYTVCRGYTLNIEYIVVVAYDSHCRELPYKRYSKANPGRHAPTEMRSRLRRRHLKQGD